MATAKNTTSRTVTSTHPSAVLEKSAATPRKTRSTAAKPAAERPAPSLAKKKAATPHGTILDEQPKVSPELRQHMIRDAAYFRAERRGFTGGDPMQDWMEAEAEIDRLLGKRTEGEASH